MRVVELLNEMTDKDARYVFMRFGVNPDQTPDLKAARNKLIMQHHSDHGGNLQGIQAINAAYDVLINKPRVGAPNTSMEPEPAAAQGMADYADGRWYGGNSGNHDWGLEPEVEAEPTPVRNPRYDRYRQQQ